MDRTIAPHYKEIGHIHFIEPQSFNLANGMQALVFKSGTQEVVKIELNFKAGTVYQNKNLQAATCNALLREGSQNFSAEKLAEQLDFYGLFLSLSAEKDWAKISLYSLTKHIDKGLDILVDILTYPSFDEHQLQLYLSKTRQRFKMDMEKVKFIANRTFNAELFRGHTYAKVLEEDDFNNIHREDLISFFKQYYQPKDCKVVIAGQFNEQILYKIKKRLETINGSSNSSSIPAFTIQSNNQSLFYTEKKGAMQSGIRLGKILFNKTHEDYAAMQVLNTILGGYFGSRLMKNIREDKGYTYGIGSAVVSLHATGYLTIVSEVNAANTQQTLDEIDKEIKVLQTDLISSDELEKVRNYMLGQFLRNMDGAFAQSDTYTEAWLYNLNWEYYHRLIQTIKTIQAKQIRDLSNQYLQTDSLIRVIAGKM
ncbi:MAG: insulinase family protein [Bacteroidales bacterium]|nr:insulinase family protein [Bacteroidales bacterium]